jgi:hypothetical protein
MKFTRATMCACVCFSSDFIHCINIGGKVTRSSWLIEDNLQL